MHGVIAAVVVAVVQTFLATHSAEPRPRRQQGAAADADAWGLLHLP